MRAPEEVFEGRGPVREEDGRRVRRQAARHQRESGGGSGIPRPAQRPAVRLQPHG